MNMRGGMLEIKGSELIAWLNNFYKNSSDDRILIIDNFQFDLTNYSLNNKILKSISNNGITISIDDNKTYKIMNEIEAKAIPVILKNDNSNPFNVLPSSKNKELPLLETRNSNLADKARLQTEEAARLKAIAEAKETARLQVIKETEEVARLKTVPESDDNMPDKWSIANEKNILKPIYENDLKIRPKKNDFTTLFGLYDTDYANNKKKYKQLLLDLLQTKKMINDELNKPPPESINLADIIQKNIKTTESYINNIIKEITNISRKIDKINSDKSELKLLKNENFNTFNAHIKDTKNILSKLIDKKEQYYSLYKNLVKQQQEFIPQGGRRRTKKHRNNKKRRPTKKYKNRKH